MSGMEKKINIFDIELDELCAKDAMKQVMQYIEGETISTVEVITMEMLIQGQENPEWKEQIQTIDLLLPGNTEILEAAGIAEKRDIKDLENKVFLKMFLKYLQRNGKRVFLLTAQESELAVLKEVLEPYQQGIVIAGEAILPEAGGCEENVINEINGVEPDCVISVLPCPWQEAFISKNRALLNARLWFGGSMLLQKDTEKKPSGKIRQFFLKKFFRYLVGREQNNQ